MSRASHPQRSPKGGSPAEIKIWHVGSEGERGRGERARQKKGFPCRLGGGSLSETLLSWLRRGVPRLGPLAGRTCAFGPAGAPAPGGAQRERGKEGLSSGHPAQRGAAEAQAFLPAMTMLLLEFWQ